MNLFFPLKKNFKNILFYSLITGREFVLLIKLFTVTTMGISKKTFKRITRHSIRHCLQCPSLKQAFHSGENVFGRGREVFHKDGLMIRSCQDESFTNAFFSNVKTVNLKNPRGFMEEFILEVNNQEVSKVISCSLSLVLTFTYGTDIFFKKLTL